MKISNAVKLSMIVVVVSFISTVTGYVFGARANSRINEKPTEKETAVEIVSNEEKSIEKVPEKTVVTQSYLLKNADGHIALYHKYSDGEERLYKNYDIPVKMLPQSDREALEKGIETGSLSEALQLIEDYS